MALLEVNNVQKVYTTRWRHWVQALSHIGLRGGGEYVAIMGESGSGKPAAEHTGGAGPAHLRQVALTAGPCLPYPIETGRPSTPTGLCAQDYNLLDTLSSATTFTALFQAAARRRTWRAALSPWPQLDILPIGEVPYEVRRRKAAHSVGLH